MNTPPNNEEIEYTVAFYNIENLFDIFDDKTKYDNDFLPDSQKRWTLNRYKKKLKKIGFAISNIGVKQTKKHPALIGIAEVENAKVIQDLINSKHLTDFPYDFVHFDSPDERGIDVALLYDKTIFKVAHAEAFNVVLKDDKGNPDYTRDVLLVSGLFEGTELHVIVNHWPSKREGSAETEHKRLAASQKVIDVIADLKTKSPDAKIIVMGDFNDDPSSKSIKQLVKAHGLFNPMQTLLSYSRGTSSHNKAWNLFDQIIVTPNFFEQDAGTLSYVEADIFDSDFLKIFNGKYKGTPYRTFVGTKYKGGYSDHFPVHITIKKNN